MIRFLYRVDEWIIAVLERFGHKFQLLTGKTNFFLAKLALMILLLCTLTRMVIKVSESKGFGTEAGLDFLTIVMMLTVILWYYDSEERKAIVRLCDGMKNPMKIHPVYRTIRIMFFTLIGSLRLMTILLLGIVWVRKGHMHWDLIIHPWYWEASEVSIFLWVYFEACDPLPPCSGKIQQLLMKFFAKLQPATNQISS